MRRWSVRNDNLTIVRRSASYAVLDALRPVLNARRRIVTQIVTHRIQTLERAQR
ncbi:hypothetical protein KPSA1_07314 [Pseudomonas syringae pv. actinidiae]|uniref:Uncharacterized protein n=1 Tax=Pseudomonas syringae pv. actinidiae TaxID=103796 RepID=A0A2V0QLJ0_PSESF|nr:hypothetical protein KPSA1_07314 [Pseudomonas syringae pv. actinidiae]